MHPNLTATQFKARVYFYLEPMAESGVGGFTSQPPTPLPVEDSVLGLTESQILAFLHDTHHRYAVITAPERTDECARLALESKHPGRSIVLKTVNWI